MTYETSFAGAPENPLSESGAWEAPPATWNNPVILTTAGSVNHATGPGSTGANDAVRRLSDAAGGGLWTPDQELFLTLHKPGSIPNGEAEGFLRMIMVPGTPDKIFAYEFDLTGNTGQFYLVRWDGDTQGAGAYQFLISGLNLSTAGVGAFGDGDVFHIKCTGEKGAVRCQAWKNNDQFCDFTDTDATKSLDTGNPGIGFDHNGDGDIFGWKHLIANSLGASVSAALSGTAAASVNEGDVVAGGKTIILTLTGDTFIAP